MKDALGHGSNPRGSHASGVDSLPKAQTLVGYHGTASQFDVPKPNAPTTHDGNRDIEGIYFSGDQRAASSYAAQALRRQGGDGARRIITANLTMSNPLDITKLIKNGQRRGLSFGDSKREAMKSLTSLHDGVIFKGDGVNAPEYIVFHPRQVKVVK